MIVKHYHCLNTIAMNKTRLFLIEICVQIIDKGLADILQRLFALPCLGGVQLLGQAQILTAHSP